MFNMAAQRVQLPRIASGRAGLKLEPHPASSTASRTVCSSRWELVWYIRTNSVNTACDQDYIDNITPSVHEESLRPPECHGRCHLHSARFRCLLCLCCLCFLFCCFCLVWFSSCGCLLLVFCVVGCVVFFAV